MSGEVKVVRVEVRHCQRDDPRVAPKESDWATHQKNGLNYISNGVEQNEGGPDAQCSSFCPEDKQPGEHHEVDSHRALDYQKVFPWRVFNKESVDLCCPDEYLVAQALSFCKHLVFVILQCRK